jgi:glycerophosphoryl diester phosphodiesterase
VSPIDLVTLDQQRANERTMNVGKPIWVWTVDQKRLMQRFMDDPRVEAIITNRPELALKLRRDRA